MVQLTHLKAEFEKRANCRCDCDGYRPDTLREWWSVEITSDAFLAAIRAEGEFLLINGLQGWAFGF